MITGRHGRWIAAGTLAVLLAACGAGHDSHSVIAGDPGRDSTPPPSGGLGSAPSVAALSVNDGNSILQYSIGAALTIPVELDDAERDSPLAVTITSSDPKIAAVSPDTCYLAGGGNANTCNVIVRTASTGSATLTVSGGEISASTQIVVGGTPPEHPNYGQVQLAAFPSAHAPSTGNVQMTAQLGQIVTIAASLTGFDTTLDGVPIFVQTSAGAMVGNPQCNVDSGVDTHQTCLYQIRLPQTAPAEGNVVVTARVVGNPSGFQAWNTPTVTIATTTTPVAGTIALETLDGNAPASLSTPAWAVLRDSSGVGDIGVTFGTNDGVTINPGVRATSGTYQRQSCTVSSESPVCGFGIRGDQPGVASIAATASVNGYAIEPLAVTVSQPLSLARMFKFRNTSNAPVWVGVTSGTSNSYQTRGLVSASDGDGPAKMCGPSNPSGACPRGSTCQQGGANPDDKTTYFCYWDQPTPSNGYQIAASGTDTTTLSISGSSYDPVADITWSGNFFPREGCTKSADGQLHCAIANCGNASSGEACAPGTGGAPAVATLPEVTLQRYNTDYYDVSIIGGANVATSFGPDRSVQSDNIPDVDGYFCGSAGGAQPQGKLPAADWNLATHVNESMVSGGSLPFSHTAQTGLTKSNAFYQYVSTVTPREAPSCTSSNACTTPGYVCGYDAAAVNHGADSDYQTSCGAPQAWLSANQLWAMNTTPSNAAPFKFFGSYATATAGTLQLNQLFSCTAPTRSGYDTANTDASATCGCTNWGDSSLASTQGDAPFTAKLASPTTPCSTNSEVNALHPWTQNVLPTIAWLKKSCPTCYTYPFDDMSSTFQCTNQAASSSGTNTVPYVITFSGHLPGL